MNSHGLVFRVPRTILVLCGGLAVLGAGALLAGLQQDPARAWPNVLLGSFYLLGLGLGALVFMALVHVTGGGWAAGLRRVPEAMAASLPIGALGLAAVFLARPSLYPWITAGPEEVSTPLRHAWLNWPFFLARAAVYFAGWILLGLALVRTSQRQDRDGDPELTRKTVRVSAAFLVVFAVTFWLASHDWLETLDPHWSSTVFAVYQFGGLFLGGLAGITLLAVVLSWLGPFREILTNARRRDLGKLLFAFSTFWMYLWFCQYMLIWYVNNPEETSYFVRRLHGAWRPLFFLNLFLNWGIPFVVLLPRSTKERAGVLAAVAIVVLAGRWLDLYLAILPGFGEPEAASAPWEIGLLAGAAGLFGLVFFVALRSGPLVPVTASFSGGVPAVAKGTVSEVGP
jgi:hypothetical protein